jgi:hypothetical protein
MKYTRLEKLVGIGTLWGILILLISIVIEPTPENFTLGFSIIFSGLYTWFIWLSRGKWLPGLRKKSRRNAILLGSLNAAVIETLFLLFEKIFGASGIAAHPNLIIDLVMTMPWYVGMVWIFVRVQERESFPPAGVLLFGAVYELGADGVVGGQIIPMIMGEPINLLTSWILMLILAFWQFIPVYSSMVLPPTWVLDTAPIDGQSKKPRWRRGLLPLLWLLPFTIYIIGLILVIGLWGS